MKPILYEPPKDENGKSYYVPISVKNKDWLVGFINGVHTSDFVSGMNYYQQVIDSLGNDRHCDITKFDKTLRYMTKNEIREYAKEMIELSNREFNPKDDDNEYQDTSFLNITCKCGNSYFYRDSHEIPNKNLVCSCGRLVIEYTKRDDDFITYNGVEGKDINFLQNYILEITNEMIDEKEDPEFE